VVFPEIARGRGLTRVQAILAEFEKDSDIESSIAPSGYGESVLASTMGAAKSTRSVNKAKFMELIDQSKGLLGDLQEHEEMRESRAAMFYNPNAPGNEDAQVMNLDGRPEKLDAVDEEEEGQVVTEGKKGRFALQRDLELLGENDEGF